MINPNPINNMMGVAVPSQNTSVIQNPRIETDNNNIIGKLIKRQAIIGLGGPQIAPQTVRSLKQDKIQLIEHQ